MRQWFRRHPGFRDLSEYVESGEQAPDWAGVRTHLRDCTRCRDTVEWIRRLDFEARSLGPVRPPFNALDAIIARRDSGDRVIVPSHGPLDPSRPRRPRAHRLTPVLAGIGVLVVAAGAILVPSGTATAGGSELRFDPAAPAPGDAVEVRYLPTTELAGYDSLRLRVHYRAAGQSGENADVPDEWDEVTLYPSPDGQGAYEGLLEIPAVAVYGQLAVETFEAAAVDARNGRMWELLTYRDGVPRYESLRQRRIAAAGVDWRRTIETARQMTELYPDRPEGWYELLEAERSSTAPGDLYEHHERFQAQFVRLQRDLTGGELSARDMEMMVLLAAAVEDERAERYWLSILRIHDRRNPTIARRALHDASRDGADMAGLLDTMEDAWADGGMRAADVTLTGVMLAVGIDRADLAERWASRTVDLDHRQAGQVGRLLVDLPESRSAGFELLREAVNHVICDRPRPLALTRAAYELAVRDELGALHSDMVTVLLDAGDLDGAAELIAEAGINLTSLDATTAVRAAEAALSIGDEAAAHQLILTAVSDPMAPQAAARRASDLVSRLALSWPEAGAEIAEAKHRRSAALRAASAYQHLGSEATAVTEDGRDVHLASLARGVPVLISVATLFADEDTELVASGWQDLHERAVSRGLSFAAVAVPVRGLAPNAAPFPPAEYPVLYDYAALVPSLFGAWSARAFVVLDAEGVFRGTFTTEEEALRLLLSLPPGRQLA